MIFFFFFFFKQKTAYEITTGDWSSDVCSSDLDELLDRRPQGSRRVVTAVGLTEDEDALRSEERRVGKECRLLCRSRWSPSHLKKRTKDRLRELAVFQACLFQYCLVAG